ncbi:MAG: VWA domain-containing protein [Anaerolineales bacterium]|nr:VWA domain-containing protein [Anaerolineales bacterium]MCA9932262.1 VWA domain-containing protein [Anaerolineales bacterium]
MMRKRQIVLLFILITITFTAFGCRLFSSGNTMTVLAGSELKDIEPLLDEIERETGVRLEFEYIGTLNGAEALLSGAEYDLAWFSHARYLNLLAGSSGLIVTQEKTMLSPVVMGVKESVAREFGWIDNPNVTWQDIADKASSGELRFAMTNPAASNSGFTALVGVAAALSGSSDALEAGDVNDEGLRDFFTGQKLTAGSSGWLADSYVEAQDNLDGMVNYESVLLALNEGNLLREDLVLIYPQEGIITADYPLMLLNKDRREDYDGLVEFLRSTEFQKKLMETTLRRPVVPGVALDNRIPDAFLVELPFPNTVDVIDSLLFAYLDEQRVPAHAFFVLDVSGSMRGSGISDLKAAMNNLTGQDNSLTGRFSRFRSREKITIITFNDQVASIDEFIIDDTNPNGEDMQQIRSFVTSLDADGGTAIYSALTEAYRLAGEAQAQEPDRYYSIVLMSDGENTDGISPSNFERNYNVLDPSVKEIRTFTVLFGNADEDAMENIAEVTNGRLFDSTSESLSFIFKQIRGYQ